MASRRSRPSGGGSEGPADVAAAVEAVRQAAEAVRVAGGSTASDLGDVAKAVAVRDVAKAVAAAESIAKAAAAHDVAKAVAAVENVAKAAATQDVAKAVAAVEEVAREAAAQSVAKAAAVVDDVAKAAAAQDVAKAVAAVENVAKAAAAADVAKAAATVAKAPAVGVPGPESLGELEQALDRLAVALDSEDDPKAVDAALEELGALERSYAAIAAKSAAIADAARGRSGAGARGGQRRSS